MATGVAPRLAVLLCCVALVAACEADPGYNGRTSREWIALLQNGDVRQRENAAAALGQVLTINPKLEGPITALVSALADTSDAVRVAASLAISRPNVAAIDALPGLARLLDDTAHADVRVQGARALGRLLTRARPEERVQVTHALVPAHRDRDAGVRAAVADALGSASSLHVADPEIERALAALVSDPSMETRLRAVEALGEIRGPIRQKALRMALRDSSAGVRRAAIFSAMHDTTSLVALEAEIRRVLTDSSTHVRLAAVSALGALPDAPNPLVTAALRGRLIDADSAVRAEAAHALTRFHARGGHDPLSPEPSVTERCKQLPPRTRGC